MNYCWWRGVCVEWHSADLARCWEWEELASGPLLVIRGHSSHTAIGPPITVWTHASIILLSSLNICLKYALVITLLQKKKRLALSQIFPLRSLFMIVTCHDFLINSETHHAISRLLHVRLNNEDTGHTAAQHRCKAVTGKHNNSFMLS